MGQEIFNLSDGAVVPSRADDLLYHSDTHITYLGKNHDVLLGIFGARRRATMAGIVGEMEFGAGWEGISEGAPGSYVRKELWLSHPEESPVLYAEEHMRLGEGALEDLRQLQDGLSALRRQSPLPRYDGIHVLPSTMRDEHALAKRFAYKMQHRDVEYRTTAQQLKLMAEKTIQGAKKVGAKMANGYQAALLQITAAFSHF